MKRKTYIVLIDTNTTHCTNIYNNDVNNDGVATCIIVYGTDI